MNVKYYFLVRVPRICRIASAHFYWRSLIVFLIFCTSLIFSYTVFADKRGNKKVRVGFGSCVYGDRSKVYDVLWKEKFDRFLFLGDNFYIRERSVTKKALSSEYARHFVNPSLKHFMKEIRYTATWDDHDYSPMNDGDSTYPLREFSESLFRKFWKIPRRAAGFDRGLQHAFTESGVQYIVTDNRSFRTKPGTAKAAYFGEQQLEWIGTKLKSKDVAVSILVSGGQILSEHGMFHEYLRQYPKEFTVLLAALTTAPKPVIIVSGDRHYGEILIEKTDDREILEVTSSPLDAFSANDYAVTYGKNKYGQSVRGKNYGQLELWITQGEPRKITRIEAEIRSLSGQTQERYIRTFK